MAPKQSYCRSDERRGYHHGSLKDALIEAARRLVSERGLAGFTLAEAAKLVGVTGAAPYRHFADRDALVEELARRGFEQFGAGLRSAWDGGQPNARTALQRMGDAYVGFARAEPGLYAAMFGNVRTLSAPGPGAAATLALDTLKTAAAATLDEGIGRDKAARDLAFELWSLSHGVAMLSLGGHLDASDDPAPLDVLHRASGALVDAAVRRLRAKQTPPVKAEREGVPDRSPG